MTITPALAVGQSVQLLADPTAVWTSSNQDVLKVDETGQVTGVSNGSATIYATAGNKVAEITIEVDNTLSVLEVTSPDTTTLTYDLRGIRTSANRGIVLSRSTKTHL